MSCLSALQCELVQSRAERLLIEHNSKFNHESDIIRYYSDREKVNSTVITKKALIARKCLFLVCRSLNNHEKIANVSLTLKTKFH